MTGEIRKEFLSFFERKKHKVLPSSSLVPLDDPTLLFTNAGMVQFKRYFLGKGVPPSKRIATCQRCLRAGGKHNDLENVGRTSRHMTFFEMLGNFSFGDYFKKEAIEFAWELITEIFKIKRDVIYVSVYEEDREAEDIWIKHIGLEKERVVRMGKESNFWTMGDTGPAGPCSEIILDRGENRKCGENCKVGCDCDRFLEIWNLVFMEYEIKGDGTILPLPTKNIDTGMGLERIASYLQGVDSNFDIDIFEPLKNALPTHFDEFSQRVILDCARAIAFAIADGIMPSNDGRGYVIRRILRRALRIAMRKYQKPFIFKVAEVVVDTMSDFWTHLKDKKEIISHTTFMEEKRFFETIMRGINIFENYIEGLNKKIPGDVIFTFWDTHGLPIDIMEEIAKEKGFEIDIEEFHKLREKKKEERKIEKIYIPPLKSKFIDKLEMQSKIEILNIKGEKIDSIKKGEEGYIVAEETPFYPEGGGQIGDTGIIRGKNGLAVVLDTKKIENVILHRVRVEEGDFSSGEIVSLEVDKDRRRKITIHHTTTHLLHSALRYVLGTHVRQMGSLVEDKRLRFDFSHPLPLGDKVFEIEDLVEEWISRDFKVEREYMNIYDALRLGALAFFGDKYGDIVRVVKIGDVSLELCGGTHLNETGEAGGFKIIEEGGIAAGIRRVSAVAGKELLKYIREKEKYLKEIADILKVKESDLPSKIREILKKFKDTEDNFRKAKMELILKSIEVEDFDGKRIVLEYFEGVDRRILGSVADALTEREKNVIVLLLGKENEKISIVGATSSDDIDISFIVKKVSEFLGGSGGGRKNFAEGGGKILKPKNEIIQIVKSIIHK